MRQMLRLHHLAKRRIVLIMHVLIEQRPWLSAGQQRRNRRGHQIAIIPELGRGISIAPCCNGHVDSPKRKDKFLETITCEQALPLAT